MHTATLIKDCAVATGVDYIPRSDLLIAGGKIRRIAPRIAAGSARVIPGAGLLASPGLIDTQLNGGFGHSFSDATPAEVAEVGRKLLTFGVTGYLPTLISQPRKTTLRAIQALVAASKIPGGASILGIHLEGPFLAPKRNGAHQLKNLRLPTLEEFREYHRAARGLLRMMTLAPERNGALEVIREGTRRGVIMSAGHSEATAAQISTAVSKAGLRHVTHIFNAMSPLHHREETILNAALLIDRLSCGFIYDRDHISSGPATLLLRLKPAGQLVLVSDAVAAMGLPDGELRRDGEVYVIKDGVVRVKSNGRLAGSASSILDGVRRLVEDTGIAPHRALSLATHAPARLLGLEGRKGMLKPGADADLVLLDRSLMVRMTFVGGELLHGNHH
ncbi:MAG TPA: N-acetylglucosamine-6-phosphate deacetylase [Planctomycetota bacterium]|nr:N-acetylglucosamine-6-phosphate deacetylase [Planctomycetota bacterium]